MAKFREHAHNVVFVYLAVIRIPEVQTDILISMNTPEYIDHLSSSAGAVPVASEETLATFHEVLASFQILDWSLFVPE